MNRPIILDNVIERHGNKNKIFKYNYELDMNCVDIDGKNILYLDMNDYLKNNTNNKEKYIEKFNIFELFTKTEVSRERDDEEMSLLELETKTFLGRERDDEESIDSN